MLLILNASNAFSGLENHWKRNLCLMWVSGLENHWLRNLFLMWGNNKNSLDAKLALYDGLPTNSMVSPDKYAFLSADVWEVVLWWCRIVWFRVHMRRPMIHYLWCTLTNFFLYLFALIDMSFFSVYVKLCGIQHEQICFTAK